MWGRNDRQTERERERGRGGQLRQGATRDVWSQDTDAGADSCCIEDPPLTVHTYKHTISLSLSLSLYFRHDVYSVTPGRS